MIEVPTVELAREVGSERAGNMVMIGAFLRQDRAC